MRAALVLFGMALVAGAQAAPPTPAPRAWMGLIGQYGPDAHEIYVLENAGRLELLRKGGADRPLTAGPGDSFRLQGTPVVFTRGAGGVAAAVRIGGEVYPRRVLAISGGVFHVRPLRPLPELQREALAARPPREAGTFRSPDLVDVARLDPSIRLDIRYAGTHNFLGEPLYSEAKAYLQRPAAEALLRAVAAFKAQGYGVLVHDAYRPWYVTRMFWDATPPDQRMFVADPSQGSRHNRGCAVDLTLYALRTGRELAMPGVYDEMSERSYPSFPGGTSLQRWDRELLRHGMEAQGFTVYEDEWWHFDYQDWPHYPILNIPFERLDGARPRP